MEKKSDQVHSKIGLQDNANMGRRVEDALKEHEELYRLLADQSIMGIHIIQDGLIKYVNHATALITGYSIEEMMNWEPEGYRILLHPEELPFVMDQVRKKQTGAPDIVVNYTWRIITKSGETRWVESFSKTTLFKGSPADFVMIIDITERKLAEVKLHHEEKRFMAFAEQSSDIIAFVDREGIITFENQAIERALGFTAEERIGGKGFDRMHPDDLEFVTGEFNRLFSDGKAAPSRTEVRLCHKNGSWRTFEAVVGNLVHDNAIEAIIVNLRDITERKMAESQKEVALEKLRQSEQRYRKLADDYQAIVENTSEGIYRSIPDGRYLMANHAFAKMLGYDSPEELLCSVTNISNQIYVDGERRKESIRRTLESGHGDFEIQFKRKDGSVGWLANSVRVVRNEQGEIKYYEGVTKDITERKQMESQRGAALDALKSSHRRLDEIIDFLPDATFVIDRDGKVSTWNRAIEKMTGIPKANMIGRGNYEYAIPFYGQRRPILINLALLPDNVFENNHYEHVYRRGDTLYAEAYVPQTYGGKGAFMWGTASKLRDASGNIIGAIESIRDITEHKRAEEEIRHTQDQMRAFAARLQTVREEERTRIAREIHDELGGALTGIKIDFSLLKKAAVEIKEKSLKDHLFDQLCNTTRLIDKTIGTVRKISTELRPGILDDLGILAALEWQLNDFQKRTNIHCEWISSLEKINLDEQETTALFRIFQETLTNVVRHAGATQVHVQLRTKANTYVLEVEDNGKGITKNNIDDKRSLGLLGMRERALAVGGRIDIEGHPGKGTKVTVEIPIKQTDNYSPSRGEGSA